ncbi:MAG: Fe-S cluster assembly protein SufD, partial [Hyphomicrobiales bacterium]|nr:Fe-S cluster assembly protein SufD [Hyphomicrobiales bacterium]
YTDLRTLLKDAPALADPQAPAAQMEPALTMGARDVVLSAGRLVAGARAFEGVTVEPLDGAAFDALPDVAPPDDPAVSLNRAMALGGALVHVAAGSNAGVVHLAFRDGQDAAVSMASRVIVRVEAGATLTLVESHQSRDGLAHLTNTLVEFHLGDGANLRHVRLNAAGGQTVSLSTLVATLSEGASFETFSLTLGARVSRHQAFMRFAGEHAKGAIRGATLIRGKQHADTTIVVEHVAPNCESREAFKTVVDDDATGVFQGRIVVAPHAQKTDGRMSSNALLLSEGATMNNKPELEIFADDVQCAHGATCGDLDDNLLFYIMARGLPRKDAEALLLEAFVGAVMDSVEDEALREALMDKARGWLAGRSS